MPQSDHISNQLAVFDNSFGSPGCSDNHYPPFLLNETKQKLSKFMEGQRDANGWEKIALKLVLNFFRWPEI